MDFYTHQERAKRQTLHFIVLFCLGVLGIIAVTYFLLAFINATALYGDNFSNQALWNPHILIFSTLFTLCVVGASSLYKIAQLKSGGGAYVAEQVGGRRISTDTTNYDERKVLNVVEEVAIAAGLPTPAVYILDHERGINAFAAGYSEDTAVIGVTKGAVEHLSRDELQGVIAHEFSHICNGDMRINIRLMGILFGIMVLGIIGYYTLRSSFYLRGSSRKSAPGQMAVFLLGMGLILIGMVGSFFGQMIKAAINRQREYLADATAVEYTRQTDTIGSALRKIREHASKGYVVNPHATEMSHMFFVQGFISSLGSLFASHPPLDERIKRIYTVEAEKLEEQKKTIKPKSYKPERPSMQKMLAASVLMATAEQPSVNQIERAKKLIESIPKPLRDALHEPYGARAVVFGLLLSKDEAMRAKQLKYLAEHSRYGAYTEVSRLVPEFEKLDLRCRLPLLDMCLPTLTLLSKAQYEQFMSNVDGLILADNSVDLFEWVLEKILIHNVQPHFMREARGEGNDELKDHAWDAALLLQTLAFVGHKETKEYQEAFKSGMKKLGYKTSKLPEFPEKDFAKLNKVIDSLKGLKMADKQKLLEACLTTMVHDKVITVYEAELFRAFADVLGVNIPLILPGELSKAL
ncbi:MAG: M48 family metallopeptidase [Chlamydiia bacterium]|nr:M48 family metallopeptidase [Chlamydiia bacterium]